MGRFESCGYTRNLGDYVAHVGVMWSLYSLCSFSSLLFALSFWIIESIYDSGDSSILNKFFFLFCNRRKRWYFINYESVNLFFALKKIASIWICWYYLGNSKMMSFVFLRLTWHRILVSCTIDPYLTMTCLFYFENLPFTTIPSSPYIVWKSYKLYDQTRRNTITLVNLQIRCYWRTNKIIVRNKLIVKNL